VARRGDPRARLALVTAVVILVAWVVSFALDIWVESYDPHPSITPLMLATVGWLFGGEVVAKIRGSDPDPEHEEVEQ
jgi:lipopolysaccharide export LptBFGC system permease protein LptF